MGLLEEGTCEIESGARGAHTRNGVIIVGNGSRRHSLPFHDVALRSLSRVVGIRRQTCGEEHDKEGTVRF